MIKIFHRYCQVSVQGPSMMSHIACLTFKHFQTDHKYFAIFDKLAPDLLKKGRKQTGCKHEGDI